VATKKGYRLHPDDVEETKEIMGRARKEDSDEEDGGVETDDSGSEGEENN